MDNGYKTIIQLKREREAKQSVKYKTDSKQRLKNISKKKIQTTMIGALDSIEKHLGFLWEDEENLKKIYDIVRQEILDRGNGQIRNLEAELDQYDIEWLRYNITLPVKRRTQDDNQQD